MSAPTTVPAVDDPLEALLALATRLAGGAARLQREGLERARTDLGTKSSATDMVTEVDRACEELIVDGIRAARPDDGILGEEGTSIAGTSGLRWVVDPLDGTTNYIYGHPGFAVSIAVERDREVLVGVVEDTVHGEVFTAVRGVGAKCNGEPVGPTGNTELGSALVATGIGYAAGQRRDQAQALTGVIGRVRDVRRMGAAAVDLCSVACGRVDAYFERGLSPWDLAAGALIAAKPEPRSGQSRMAAVPGSVIAATPALLEPLRALLAEAGA